MNSKCKKYPLFYMAILCVIFVISHIYSDYNVLLEADFICQELKFEATDLENLVADKPKILDFAPSTLVTVRPLNSELFEQSANSYFQLATPYQSTPPLRC
jgi:hypothetical protein